MDLSRPGLEHLRASALQNAAVALIALVSITLALYHETVGSLLRMWIHGYTYEHGLVVVAISGFLFYRRWHEVDRIIQVRPSSSAAVLVLLVSFVWFLASLVHVLIVQQVSLMLLLGALVMSVVGYRSARLFAVPVALLVFTVPVWDPLVPYLQQLLANVVTVLLNLTGIPAYLQGTAISVPAGTFEVKPACSGISQLMVGTMVGVLFAHTKRLTRKTATWVVAAAAGVSILTNTLRIYTTVVIGQLSGMQSYFVTQHWAPGWVLFGLGMFSFFLLAGRLTGQDQAPSTASAHTPGAIVTENRTSLVQSALLTLSALVIGPALVYAYQSDGREIGQLAFNLPAEIEGWQAELPPSRGYRPVFHGPDLEHERLYHDAQGGQVYLYVAEYAYQEQGKKAVSNLNTVYGDETWEPVLTRTQRLGESATVKEALIRSRAGAEKLVWQWYYVHGSVVSSGYMAKLQNAWGTLNGDPAIAAVVVATDLEGGYEGTAALLTRFVTDTRQTVERAIDQTRQH